MKRWLSACWLAHPTLEGFYRLRVRRQSFREPDVLFGLGSFRVPVVAAPALGGPDAGPARRAVDRHAARNLQHPQQPVCRGGNRLAADQLHSVHPRRGRRRLCRRRYRARSRVRHRRPGRRLCDRHPARGHRRRVIDRRRHCHRRNHLRSRTAGRVHHCRRHRRRSCDPRATRRPTRVRLGRGGSSDLQRRQMPPVRRRNRQPIGDRPHLLKHLGADYVGGEMPNRFTGTKVRPSPPAAGLSLAMLLCLLGSSPVLASLRLRRDLIYCKRTIIFVIRKCCNQDECGFHQSTDPP